MDTKHVLKFLDTQAINCSLDKPKYDNLTKKLINLLQSFERKLTTMQNLLLKNQVYPLLHLTPPLTSDSSFWYVL